MESLTKENFWNDLQTKHPETMKVFCDWIDGYKKRVNWDQLFSVHPWSTRTDRPATKDDYETHKRGEINPGQYKYHHIPIAMQLGIFLQFVFEVEGRVGEMLMGLQDFIGDPAELIREWFATTNIGK
jgi:hypothetical protein